MADQTLILSVDEEAKLLQPIDEYVGFKSRSTHFAWKALI